MARRRTRGVDDSVSRTALLDAAESLMVEHGYDGGHHTHAVYATWPA